MAINPLLAKDAVTQEFFPFPVTAEVFILKRNGISFKVETPTGTMKGSGSFFLTSRRIVFLKSGIPEKHKEFSSFEIPLHLISEPKFEQPIFGANYIKGKVDPFITAENPVGGLSKWFLTFNNGGCGTFLNVFFRLYKDAKRNYVTATTEFSSQLFLGANAAFVDPTDPSVVYISQPHPVNFTGNNTGGIYPTVEAPMNPPPLASYLNQTSSHVTPLYSQPRPPHPEYAPQPHPPHPEYAPQPHPPHPEYAPQQLAPRIPNYLSNRPPPQNPNYNEQNHC